MKSKNGLGALLIVVLLVVLGVWAHATSLGTGSQFAPRYGTAVVPTCTNDALGAGYFAMSTGGSVNGRYLVCTSTQGSAVGYGWRTLRLNTSLAL